MKTIYERLDSKISQLKSVGYAVTLSGNPWPNPIAVTLLHGLYGATIAVDPLPCDFAYETCKLISDALYEAEEAIERMEDGDAD